jgi:hypothetical protein
MVQLWKHGKSSTRKISITLETVIKQPAEPTTVKNMAPIILANAAPPKSAKGHFGSDKYVTKNLKLVFQIKGST